MVSSSYESYMIPGMPGHVSEPPAPMDLNGSILPDAVGNDEDDSDEYEPSLSDLPEVKEKVREEEGEQHYSDEYDEPVNEPSIKVMHVNKGKGKKERVPKEEKE